MSVQLSSTATASDVLQDLLATVIQLHAELLELERTFALMHRAEQRAVEMWRQQHRPERKELFLPPTTELTMWLLEELDKARAAAAQ